MTNITPTQIQGLWLCFSSLLIASPVRAEKVYQEAGGVVEMEVENTDSSLGLWEKKNALSGYTGSGYLQFTGNNYSLGEPKSPLMFHFRIQQSGSYVIDLRCAKTEVDGHDDWANDCYVRVIGDFTASLGSYDIPDNPASLSMLKSNLKYFGGKVDAWEWASGDAAQTGGRLDPGGKNNKRKAIYHFKAGETYTLVVSGRSKSFRADRIVFRNTLVPATETQDVTRAESLTIEGKGAVPDDLDTTIKMADFTGESHPETDAIIRRNETTDVAAIRNGSWICFDDFDFGVGAGTCIEIVASSVGSGGTIEVRTDSETGTLLGTVRVRRTWSVEDYACFNGNLKSTNGRKTLYLVFKGGDGDLLNLRNFIIRSGETVQEKLDIPPVRPPAGRVAFVADGNSPDPDDIGGTAAALAMLRATRLDNRLVHCSHSCDLVKADNISAEDERRRQHLMQEACDGTVKVWGGFEGLTFWNCRTQQNEAVADLRNAINASSESDPLWIIEAGEPDIIGYALEAADASKCRFVRIITHHPVNDRSGDHFKWPQIEQFGTEIVRIPDQNGTTYARLDQGLQRPLWAFFWARHHADKRVNWLWEQVKIAEQDHVVGFQRNKCDISDAGMMFYWITGANVNNGYRAPDMDDIRDLFENSLSTRP